MDMYNKNVLIQYGLFVSDIRGYVTKFMFIFSTYDIQYHCLKIIGLSTWWTIFEEWRVSFHSSRHSFKVAISFNDEFCDYWVMSYLSLYPTQFHLEAMILPPRSQPVSTYSPQKRYNRETATNKSSPDPVVLQTNFYFALYEIKLYFIF